MSACLCVCWCVSVYRVRERSSKDFLSGCAPSSNSGSSSVKTLAQVVDFAYQGSLLAFLFPCVKPVLPVLLHSAFVCPLSCSVLSRSACFVLVAVADGGGGGEFVPSTLIAAAEHRHCPAAPVREWHLHSPPRNSRFLPVLCCGSLFSCPPPRVMSTAYCVSSERRLALPCVGLSVRLSVSRFFPPLLTAAAATAAVSRPTR